MHDHTLNSLLEIRALIPEEVFIPFTKKWSNSEMVFDQPLSLNLILISHNHSQDDHRKNTISSQGTTKFA